MDDDLRERIRVRQPSDAEKKTVNVIAGNNPTLSDDELPDEYFIRCLKQTFNPGKDVDEGEER